MAPTKARYRMRSTLVRFNDAFHTVYTNAGTVIRPTPLLLVESDYLVLWRTAEDREIIGTYTPALYHDLKMVCHLPLAFATALQPLFDSKLNLTQGYPSRPNGNEPVCLTPFVHAAVADLSSHLSVLDDDDFEARFQHTVDATVLANQQLILKTSKAFAATLLATNTTTLNDVIRFAAKHQAILKHNLELAAAAQVAMLHQVVNGVLASLGANASKLVIGVTTSIMAKNQSLVSQYFSRRYGVPTNQNQRFYVMEQVSTEPDNLGLISTHVLDSVAGDWFFGDTFRLWRDALADGAHEALDKLFPSHSSSTRGTPTSGMLTTKELPTATTTETAQPSQRCQCGDERMHYLWIGIGIGIGAAVVLGLLFAACRTMAKSPRSKAVYLDEPLLGE